MSPDLSPSESDVPHRRRGRPCRPAPPKLDDEELYRVVKKLLKIDADRRRGGKRYWELIYQGTGVDGQEVTVTRQVSIYEVHSKVKRIFKAVGCETTAEVASRWENLATGQLQSVETIVLAVSRSERPRSVDGHRYSWKVLDHRCFQLVREVEDQGQCFAALPSFPALQEELGVGLRAIQKSIVRMRKESQDSPGLRVHVDFWLGEPPRGYTGPIFPWLWVSRWGTRTAAEAEQRGLYPAATNDQAAQSRGLVWSRLAARN